jgi:hypothetical protein
VPDEYLDENGLYGTEARIRGRWEALTQRGLTGLVVRTEQSEGLELLADLAGTRGTVEG